MNLTVLDKIKSRGYWQIIIRPTKFSNELIVTLEECKNILRDNQVRLRGWYFPSFETQAVNKRLDFIELQVDFQGTLESWRFYQSGQFIFYCALQEDWVSEVTGWRMTGPEIEPNSVLEIISSLYQITEAYEFASRIAQKGYLSGNLLIRVNLCNVLKRRLFFWPGSGRRIRENYICHEKDLPKEEEFNTNDFITRSSEISYEHFVWLMERFDFTPSEAVFKRDQEKLLEGKL